MRDSPSQILPSVPGAQKSSDARAIGRQVPDSHCVLCGRPWSGIVTQSPRTCRRHAGHPTNSGPSARDRWAGLRQVLNFSRNTATLKAFAPLLTRHERTLCQAGSRQEICLIHPTQLRCLQTFRPKNPVFHRNFCVYKGLLAVCESVPPSLSPPNLLHAQDTAKPDLQLPSKSRPERHQSAYHFAFTSVEALLVVRPTRNPSRPPVLRLVSCHPHPFCHLVLFGQIVPV